MTQTHTLKPCPFCGGEPLLMQSRHASKLWLIVCKNCDAGPNSSLSEGEAVEAWNRRAPDASQSAEIAGLRNLNDDAHSIIGRIWSIFGNPSYDELNGRTIYDLVQSAVDKNAEIGRLRNKVPARSLTDSQLRDEINAVDAVINAGFEEGGGSPGEWWYERSDELEHERKRRELEAQLSAHNARAALEPRS